MESSADDGFGVRASGEPGFGIPINEKTVLRELLVGQPFQVRYFGTTVNARIVKQTRRAVVLAIDAPVGFAGKALLPFGRVPPVV